MVELVLKNVLDDLRTSCAALVPHVQSYRGGYDKADRRRIERAFFSGQVPHCQQHRSTGRADDRHDQHQRARARHRHWAAGRRADAWLSLVRRQPAPGTPRASHALLTQTGNRPLWPRGPRWAGHARVLRLAHRPALCSHARRAVQQARRGVGRRRRQPAHTGAASALRRRRGASLCALHRHRPAAARCGRRAAVWRCNAGPGPRARGHRTACCLCYRPAVLAAARRRSAAAVRRGSATHRAGPGCRAAAASPHPHRHVPVLRGVLHAVRGLRLSLPGAARTHADSLTVAGPDAADHAPRH